MSDLISRIVQGEEIQAKCQTPRKWMIKGREKLGVSRIEFGKSVGCSERLIEMLEDGATITHPNIAARIVRAVGGTVRHYNQLVHRMHKARELPEPPPARQPEEPIIKKCERCGAEFVKKYNAQRFCSISCSSYNRHKERKEGKGA